MFGTGALIFASANPTDAQTYQCYVVNRLTVTDSGGSDTLLSVTSPAGTFVLNSVVRYFILLVAKTRRVSSSST